MRALPLWLAATAALTLSACSSSNNSPFENPPPSQINMLGKAAKGLVSNAPVEICPAGAASGAASCITGRTSATGEYSLTVNQPFAVPAIVTLTADAETLIKCDVAAGCGEAAFGETFAAPADFVMRTVVPSLATATVTAPVTPFTDAVVARAIDAGGASDANVAAARNFISAALGLSGAVDVLGLTPVDITNPTELAAAGAQAHDYSFFLAGVAAANAADPKAAVEALTAAFVGGLSQADYQSLVVATQGQLQALNAAQRAGLVATAEFQAANTPAGGFTPPPPANVDSVAQAKSAVAQLRQIFNDVVALEEPLEAFGPQVEAAAAAAEQSEPLLAALFDAISVAFSDLAVVAPDGPQSCFTGPQTVSDENFSVDVTLTCSVDSEAQSRTISVSGSAGSYDIDALKLVATENVYAILIDDPDAPPAAEPGEGTEPLGFDITLGSIAQTDGPAASFTISAGGITLDIDKGSVFDLIDEDDVSVVRGLLLAVEARAEFAVPPPVGSAFFEGEFRVSASSADAEADPVLNQLRFAGSIGVNEAVALASIEYTPDAEAAGPEGFKGRITLTLDTSGIPNVPALQLVATGRFLQFVDDGDKVEFEGTVTFVRNAAQLVRVQFIGGDDVDTEGLDLDNRLIVEVGTGASGVTLVYREVEGDDVVGRINVGDDQVAIVSRSAGASALLIRYSDGSFESLF